METTDGERVTRAFGGLPATTLELVSLLNLPPDPEVVELVDVGVHTFLSAHECSQPEIAADYLDFAFSRVAALVGPTCGRPEAEEALARLVRAIVSSRLLPSATSFLSDVFGLATWAAPPSPSVDELPPLASEYLELTLGGRGDDARSLVRGAVREGTGVAEVLLDVLEPAQREIGRLWQLGQITVGQEHYCTAVTQLVMTDLEPLLFTGQDTGHRLVAVDAPGSLHQVGLRMVVDLLESEGWNTLHHGPTDPRDVPDLLHSHRAAVLAVSVSMPDQIAAVRAMISAVRSDPRTRGVKILVGGRPFSVAPELADAVGADAWARDAASAVDACERLVARYA